MIATMLIGGLGNQMFQYAVGRALALRHDTGLTLDLSSFGRDRGEAVARQFELDRLAIRATPANRGIDGALMLARRPSRILRRLSSWRALREGPATYDPAFVTAPDRSYLIGYWQSWRYAADYTEQIAADLQPVAPLSPRTQTAMAAMRDAPSVSLHVRRGDYLHAAHSAQHPVLDRDYYIEAVRRVMAAEPAAMLHVFSDDLDWCREAFAPLGWPLTMIDWNRGEDSWQDMFLMSACRHSIVANSSFSWWGAWLGDRRAANSGRRVIAPRRWFGSGKEQAEDRCPPTWTLL